MMRERSKDERCNCESEVEAESSRVRRGFHCFGVKFCSMRMLQMTPYREKKKKKRWNNAVLRLETRKPFEPCESVIVHRTVRSDRGLYGSMIFFAWSSSSP